MAFVTHMSPNVPHKDLPVILAARALAMAPLTNKVFGVRVLKDNVVL